MLFTDRDWLTIDDVAALDPSAPEVARTEGIATEGPTGLVHMAIEECANQLLSEMTGFPNYYALQSLVGNIESMGALNDSTPPPRIKLGRVVVDSFTTSYASPLKKYTAALALRNLYQIASNRKIDKDDKFQSKLKSVERDIECKYWPALWASGLPTVFTPVHCPGALYELNQGVWGIDNVTQVSGGSGAANAWDVAITWFSKQSETAESASSQTISFSLSASNFIHIDISSLTPTNPNIVSWNVYAGRQGGPLFFQASVPLATKTYTFTGDPTLTGKVVGRGQTQDCALTFIHAFNRG